MKRALLLACALAGCTQAPAPPQPLGRPALLRLAPGERASLEPLNPPTRVVEVQLAPGEHATRETLVAKEVRLELALAPGETASAAPLTPKVLAPERRPESGRR